MNVFEQFDTTDKPPVRPHRRSRSAVLALAAGVVALVAVVVGAVLGAKILLAGHGPSCTSHELADQKTITAYLTNAVDITAADPSSTRVDPIGCSAGGNGIGAHAGIMDDVALDQMRDVLKQAGCVVPADLPATCTMRLGTVLATVTVVAQPGDNDGDYDVAIVRPAASSTATG